MDQERLNILSGRMEMALCKKKIDNMRHSYSSLEDVCLDCIEKINNPNLIQCRTCGVFQLKEHIRNKRIPQRLKSK